MNAADTFLFPGGDNHLWMIISDPSVDPEHIVIVRFLSWTEKYDQSCVLNGGEHPFVKHPSCVDYPAAIWNVTDAHLEALKRTGELRLKAPLSQELLTLIRKKADESQQIPTRAYEILREQGFVP